MGNNSLPGSALGIPLMSDQIVCTNCGKIFSLEKNIPINECVCPTCGKEISLNIILRNWWHDILRKTKHQYLCYAFVLLLPSDANALNYYTNYYDEMDLLTGNSCCLLALGYDHFKLGGINGNKWVEYLKNDVSRGYSLHMVEKLFGKGFTDSPCMIFFNDIRSPDHVVVSIKGLTLEEISTKMRQIFSLIKRAEEEHGNVVEMLKKNQINEVNQKNAEIIKEQAIKFGELTFEKVVETIFRIGFK